MRKSNQRKKELGQANREAFESAGLTYEGKSIKKIGKATGFGHAHITNLIRKYYEEGLQAISEKHYAGNRRNMNIDEKVMPWSRHPKQADEEEIASSKNKQQAYPDDLKLCPLL